MRLHQAIAILAAAIFLPAATAAAQQADPTFYVFICFGQSNMEGSAPIEDQDKTVNDRFQVFAVVGAPNLRREKGKWYPAAPPLCRGTTGLCPADYFGRTLVANLPEHIRVGVINVSVAGTKIELFDEDTREEYAKTAEPWKANIIKQYEGNPYARLVEAAKAAQKDGVIKGILLHQGESNTGDHEWPSKVKKIYDRLMSDLSLDPKAVPLLAGEVVHADQKGVCASMNSIIAKLPDTLPNSYVVTSSGVPCGPDHLHFTSAGYRDLGKRYAETMLPLLGYEMRVAPKGDSQP